MIQIPTAVAVTLIIIIHTILTHLINWGIREGRNVGDTNVAFMLIFFSLLEIYLTIALLCNMKPV